MEYGGTSRTERREGTVNQWEWQAPQLPGPYLLSEIAGGSKIIDPLKLLLFITLSAIVAGASLHAWRTRQAYGFFRFFAFESLIILIVSNTNRWFHDPFSVQQILSWIIFGVSMILAVHGFHLLRVIGGAQRRIMEDTRNIVEVGVYRYIRHPLYTALILFGWGVFLKDTDSTSAALAFAATIFWFATALYEEHFNIDRFGSEYTEYMKRTRMFIPFLL